MNLDQRASQAEWVDAQKRTLTFWVNEKLQGTGFEVQDLAADLDSGTVLIKLLEVLAPGKKMPNK